MYYKVMESRKKILLNIIGIVLLLMVVSLTLTAIFRKSIEKSLIYKS